jgi:4-diphosphocytidyl-2-C-methyl-D-erythritol kinase
MRLRALAPGKVNLSLFLGPTRSEGRHELVTVFQSLSLADVVELEVMAGAADDAVICPGVTGENLAARALAALRQRGWDGPPVTVSIEKAIPVAAGMAGGSADAAATLRLAMAVAPGRAEEVEAIAAGLGADVPGQLLPGLSLGTGAGEIVEKFGGVGQVAFVVVPATDLALSTPDVFREADRLGLPRDPAELAQRYEQLVAALGTGGRLPDELVVNDLEPAAISLCPWCGVALEAVRATGADHALVSGSGPTVVGIWWGDGARLRASDAAQTLAVTLPGAVVVEAVDVQFALPSLI